MGIGARRWWFVAMASGVSLGIGLGASPVGAIATKLAIQADTVPIDQVHNDPLVKDLWTRSTPQSIWAAPVLAPALNPVLPPVLAQANNASSRSLYEQGRYNEALAALEREIARLDSRSMARAAALGNLALLQDRLGQPQQAIASLTQALALSSDLGDSSHVTADLLSLRGQLALNQDQAEVALSHWEAAEERYNQLNRSADLTRSRIAQAQALQRLGFYRRALQKLSDMADRLESQPDGAEKVIQLQALGDALQLVGDGQQAEPLLLKALTLAQQLELAREESSIALSLGNSTAAQINDSAARKDSAAVQQKIQTALDYYDQAIARATTVSQQRQGQINQFSLLVSQNDPAADGMVAGLVNSFTQPEVREQAVAGSEVAQGRTVGSSRDRQAKLKFGYALAQLPDQQYLAQQMLRQSLRDAQAVNDLRSQSYALGYLGSLYQQQGQVADALMLTRQALELAESMSAVEIAYRWHWQLGQLQVQNGDTTEAIASYDDAIRDLEILRGDLSAVNRDVQFSFRERVEPVYRESVALLLETSPDSQDNLDQARQHIEALQLAELDNFFREACLDAQSITIDEVVDQDNPTAAVIYPIILADRMEVIAKIPQQPLQRYSIDKSKDEIEKVALELQEALLETDETFEVKELSKQLHEWLIEPLEPQLARTASQDGPTGSPSAPVDTLVFVLDGPLRSLPMAALYDGEQYLIEKYAVALSLGLQLLDPRPLASQELGVLAAGLADVPKKYLPFQSLPKVLDELAFISGSLGQGKGQVKQLLDQEFTQSQLEASVRDNPFNVLHLATHGQFSSRAEDTFVLATDGPINVNQFDDLLRQRETSQDTPIELLVLSACQTASGDDRATLGLAGVAVRAGARSTLASLWNIGDDSTSLLIGEFYQELSKGNVTKAEALRRAQLTLLRDYGSFAKPNAWAPYVLVGNWL